MHSSLVSGRRSHDLCSARMPRAPEIPHRRASPAPSWGSDRQEDTRPPSCTQRRGSVARQSAVIAAVARRCRHEEGRHEEGQASLFRCRRISSDASDRATKRSEQPEQPRGSEQPEQPGSSKRGQASVFRRMRRAEVIVAEGSERGQASVLREQQEGQASVLRSRRRAEPQFGRV